MDGSRACLLGLPKVSVIVDLLDEFGAISALFRPLAEGAPEARGLLDDVAVIPGGEFDLAVTTDAIVEGVHFLPTDPLDMVARKLLRVNLSDLAAKGAEPYGYLMTIAWSPKCGHGRRRAFAEGLADDQEAYGIKLFGGDTVSTTGPLTCSLTAIGRAPRGSIVPRAGARAGQFVLVSGPIGDGHLGLRAATGEALGGLAQDHVYFLKRYRLPEPPTDKALLVRAHARSSCDVSDGLIADAGHLAHASGVRLEIDLDAVPLSEPAKRMVARGFDKRELVVGGDDYQILCTADETGARALIEAGFSVIGDVVDGEGVVLFGEDGLEIPLERTGWRHR